MAIHLRHAVRLAAAVALSASLLGAVPGAATAAPVSVFKTSFSLGQFEQLTGAKMTKTVGGRTFFSFFKSTSTLRDQGFNFFINRKTGRIVFRSLSTAKSPFRFASVFTETGSRERTNVAFNWSNPRALAIRGFQKPVAVSLN